jgi:hypothetical protein
MAIIGGYVVAAAAAAGGYGKTAQKAQSDNAKTLTRLWLSLLLTPANLTHSRPDCREGSKTPKES